jgi:hypothetical protein
MDRVIITLRQQATKTLSTLQKEIAKREEELEELKAEAARWKSVEGQEGEEKQRRLPESLNRTPGPLTGEVAAPDQAGNCIMRL